jgi:hypothetical protein
MNHKLDGRMRGRAVGGAAGRSLVGLLFSTASVPRAYFEHIALIFLAQFYPFGHKRSTVIGLTL